MFLMLILNSSPQKSYTDKISKLLHLLNSKYSNKHEFKMADLCHKTWFMSNSKNAITSKPFRVKRYNFQVFLVFIMPTTGEILKKICEVMVSIFQNSGWFDVELPSSNKAFNRKTIEGKSTTLKTITKNYAKWITSTWLIYCVHFAWHHECWRDRWS